MRKSLFVVLLALSSTLHAYDKNFVAQHIRKALNLDTRTEIVVSSMAAPSPFGSLKVVPITINGGPYQIYLSKDEKQYIWGYPVSLTLDPDVERAKGMQLNNVRFKGSAKAPITIVEYTDLQCPYCKIVHDILSKELFTQYTTNDVRLVFKHFPLSMHPWAEIGASATECAGEQSDEAFWKMSDSLYANQATISTATVKVQIGDYAKAAGLNATKFNQCVESEKYNTKIQADRREGAAVGVNSTPTLFVNGRMIRGIRTFDDLKVVIEEKKKEAARK
jgi:protein-disulfide isomerase